MFIQLVSFLLLWQTSEVPFRAKDDFQVELKYDFKEKPAKDLSTIAWDADPAKAPSGPLPYLVVHVKILNAKQEEIRFKCENNLGKTLFNKKVEKGLTHNIDMGYIDDVKDRVTAHMFTLYALSEKKERINRIELLVMEDGTFMVNGEKRGKF